MLQLNTKQVTTIFFEFQHDFFYMDIIMENKKNTIKNQLFLKLT